MIYLDPEQSHLLRKINSEEIPFKNLSETDLELVGYLHKLKYVKYSTKQHTYYDGIYYNQSKEYKSVYITQEGKAYIRNEDIALKEHNAAISQARTAKTTAIVSIVISVISLLCSFISHFI